jgi:2-furoyl-CoA dehydrogenase large subunit
VVGVLTGEDVKNLGSPLRVAAPVPQDYHPVAVDKVRYAGEPVAVAVAQTRAQAEDTLEAVHVEYEPLPEVVETERAMEESAPLLHEEHGSNVAIDRVLSYGDVEEAFQRADHVISGRYEYPKVSSTPIETYGIVANWGPDDEVTAWANFQGPFSMHGIMARALGIPDNKLRLIVPPDIGGGFGIKITIYPYIVLMALASKKFGCPVRWDEDRLEAMLASSSGTDRITHMDAAVSKDGEVLGWKMRFIDNVGAYIRAPEPGCLFRATGNYVSGYKLRNLEMNPIAVMTNKCPTGPNRGYGVSQLYFAIERLMDKIAAELDLDPAEVRRRNLIPASAMPYRTPSGGFYDSGNYPQTLEQVLEKADYEGLKRERDKARSSGRLFGIGIATGVDPTVSNLGYIDIVEPVAREDELASSTDAFSKVARKRRQNKSGSGQGASIHIDAAGGVNVTLSSCAQGQGHETVAAQIVDDVLGIDPSEVRVVAGMDTTTRNWTIATGGYSSRFAATGAAAVYKAAEGLKDKLREIAAHFLEAAVGDVEFSDGKAFVRGMPSTSISLRNLAGKTHWDPQSLPPGMQPGLSWVSDVTVDTLTHLDEYDRVNSSGTYGFMADVAVVEIDPETFQVHINKYVTVHDIGKALNPQIVEGQIYGATTHAVGAALYEEMVYNEDGQLLTGTLMDYLIPYAAEAPTLDIGHMESPTPYTALGAKGTGEGSTETVPAAIANAVADALIPLGIDIDRLPIAPDLLFRLVSARQAQNGRGEN